MAQKTCEADNDDKHCPCSTLRSYHTHPRDENLITAQQQILATIASSPLPTPACYFGAQPFDENTPASLRRLPTKWCACGSKTYSVASTGGALCSTHGAEVTFSTSTAAPTTTTQACSATGFPAEWVVPRNDVVKASQQFCDDLVAKQSRGSKVANNWPGTCAWVFNNDIRKITAVFSGASMCEGFTPVIEAESCKASLLKAIDWCDVSQPPPLNPKRGGTYGEKCMRWSWYAASYANAAYPCRGQYNGPDKPPTL
ncbi:MAG: hypothetical protein Q9160_007552 [Pyrenula sp. 1 TL-2023]